MKRERAEQGEKQSRSKRAKAAIAGGIALAAGLAAGGGVFREGINDVVFHKPTAQETMIADALDKSFDAEGTKVICAPPERIQRLNPFMPDEYAGRIGALGLPYAGVIWLKDSTCDLLSGMKTRPIVKSDLISNAPGHDLNRTIALENALVEVSHEASHAIRDDMNEANADCYSFQAAPELAKELGMDAALAPMLRHQLIVRLQGKHAKHADTQQYHFDLSTCRDGGPLDMNPGVQGIFPDQP